METPKANLFATITKILTGFTGLIALVAQIVGADAKLPFPLDALNLWHRWAICAALILASIAIWLLQARSRRSRLLKPDAFNLQPGNPHHLKGRTKEIRNLRQACVDSSVTWLNGKSGSGKTALVLSGLIPEVRETTILYPFYLDSWGQDWENGPYDSLAGVLQRNLTAEDRAALGLNRPITRHDLFPVLGAIRAKIGRMPLLVFDQFDDYQATHRDRFRRRGAWIKVGALIRANRFWGELSSELAAGHVHCLFVTRDDTADGLEAVRFSEPDSHRLDLLDSTNLLPVFAELSPPADSDTTPIVANPLGGWEQLKRRLERDLTREGVVLPIQIQSAIRGLAALPNHLLTVRSYERAGALPGLEAVFIERSISRAARLHRIEQGKLRTLLMALVDGNKTVPLPACELAAKVGMDNADTFALILDDFEHDGVLRRRAAPPKEPGKKDTVSAESRSASNDLWSLDHDYLSRGVLAAETRANRWFNLLKERQRSFDDAAGSLRRQWRALLPPVQQLQLLWHRLRGRFSYGEYRAFARWSVLRFTVWLLLGSSAIALFFFFKSQRDLSDTRRAASNFVKATGRTEKLVSDPALWQLASQSPQIRRAFWTEALSDPDDAARLCQKDKIDLLFHATIGLDPDEDNKRYLLDVVILPRLHDRHVRDHLLEEAPSSLAALLYQRTRLHRPTLHKALLEAPRFIENDSEQELQTRMLLALSRTRETLSPDKAAFAFRSLLSYYPRPIDFTIDSWLGDLLSVARLMSAEARREAIQLLIVALAAYNDSDVRNAYETVLATLPDVLTSEEVDKLVASLLAASQGRAANSTRNAQADVESTTDDPLKQLVAATLWTSEDFHRRADVSDALKELMRRLPSDKVESAFGSLLDGVVKHGSNTGWLLGNPLLVVTLKLTPDQIVTARTRLLEALYASDSPIVKNILARAIARAPGELSPEATNTLVTHLFDALTKSNDRLAILNLGQAMTLTRGNLLPEQDERVFKLFIEAFKQVPARDQQRFAEVLVAHSTHSPDEAQNAFIELVDATCNVDAYSNIDFADSLARSASKLDPAYAKSAFQILLDALKDARNSRSIAGLIRAVAAVPGKVEPGQAELACQILVDAFTKSFSADDRHRLADAIAILPGELPSRVAVDAVEKLLRFLGGKRSWILTLDSDRVDSKRVARAVAAMVRKAHDQESNAITMLFESLRDPNDVALVEGIAHSLNLVPTRLTDEQRRTFIEILKWPSCVGAMQDSILKKLEDDAQEKFNGDLSTAARWARRSGFDTTSPPRNRRTLESGW